MTRCEFGRGVALVGCRAGGGMSALALVVSMAGMAVPAARAAAATSAGTVRVVRPTDLSTGLLVDLGSGGSGTAFTLSLPTRAACKGDSANDGFRIQSYMVPSTVDPGLLRFGSVGPQPPGVGPDFRQPLYSVTTDPYVNEQTANADRPGDPGYIINIAAFNFAAFKPGDIAAGAYNVGIACTRGPASASQVEKFWNTVFTVAIDPADKLLGIGWTVTGGSARSDAHTATSTTVRSSSEGRASVGITGATASTSIAPRLPSARENAAVGTPTASTSPTVPLSGREPLAGEEARNLTATGGPPTATPALLAVARSTPLLSGSAASVLLWGAVLVICARMGRLFARPLRVHPAEVWA